MTLTTSRWHQLVEVNAIVNTTIIPRDDIETFGVAGYWSIAGKYGDCDEFALTKQLYLRQRGWPMSNLLMTVVRTETGEGHAVLTVRTNHGDFILDNRWNRIVPWTEDPYQFYKRQSSHDPKDWVALRQQPALWFGDLLAAWVGQN